MIYAVRFTKEAKKLDELVKTLAQEVPSAFSPVQMGADPLQNKWHWVAHGWRILPRLESHLYEPKHNALVQLNSFLYN
jgi:hypothetical protein